MDGGVLIPRLSDAEAVERLREIVDNNLGSLWLEDFSSQAQQEIIDQLPCGLCSAAEQELPESGVKAEAIRHLQHLVDLTRELHHRE